MVQVPTACNVTVFPKTVQTELVCELKLTAKPDEAVALTVNGAVPYTRLGRDAKVIVWLVGAEELDVN
jgi:hypothetical protein